MSIPRKSILSCSKGALLHTRLGYQSPEYSSESNITINNNLTPIMYPKIENFDDSTLNIQTRSVEPTPTPEPEPEPNISSNSNVPTISNKNEEKPLMTHDVIKNINVFNADSDKDLLIRALCKTIDIIENNPLMLNKYIIASEQDLNELIKLLTKADYVEIQIIDAEVSCIKSCKYKTINKILIHTGNEYVNLKHAYADVVNFFDTYKISLKFMC